MKATQKNNKLSLFSRISFGLAAVSLIISASFHGYRIHPENAAEYNLGVTMGIVMISAFAVFLAVGIVLLIIRKRK